jgi:hypothetical protein
MLIPRKLLWCSMVILGLSPQLAMGAGRDSGTLIASEPTTVPGLTLRPGAYHIHVVDHLGERFIVRVDGPKRGVHYSFLALENPAIPRPQAPGPVAWIHAPAAGKEYLRGWLFPGVPAVVEFVYPKTEAVDIAKSNQAKVPAIDPASEGRPAVIKGLSKSDLELVTLWLLSSTQVGPGDSSGGIQAERYKEEVASAPQKPVIARLPKTASNLPLTAFLGAFSLLMAVTIRTFVLLTSKKGINNSRVGFPVQRTNSCQERRS